MPEIISRKEAIARGLKRYFTGNACIHGHLSERRIYSGECWKCHLIRTSYAEQTPERRTKKRILDKARRSTAEFKARKAIQSRKYYAANPEKKREKRRRYYWRHLEKQRSRKLKYYYVGPSNPEDEQQWLRKNRAQLRALRRTLKASPSQNEASIQALNSQA